MSTPCKCKGCRIKNKPSIGPSDCKPERRCEEKPSSEFTEGQMLYDWDSKAAYYFNGCTWKPADLCQSCPTGPPGPPGPTGPTGPAGVLGLAMASDPAPSPSVSKSKAIDLAFNSRGDTMLPFISVTGANTTELSYFVYPGFAALGGNPTSFQIVASTNNPNGSFTAEIATMNGSVVAQIIVLGTSNSIPQIYATSAFNSGLLTLGESVLVFRVVGAPNGGNNTQANIYSMRLTLN